MPASSHLASDRSNTAAILAALGLAAGFLFFAYLAEGTSSGEAHGFDRWLLLALRTADTQDPIGPQWVEIAFTDLTALGGIPVAVFLTLAVAGYFLLLGKRASAVFVIVAITGGILLNSLLKMGYSRPRPDLVAHIVDIHSLSFPSGHAMVSAVTYLTLGALLTRAVQERRLKVYVLSLSIFLTALIGISRIYLGVHWPTDILAGWSAGACWAVLCWLVARVLQRRGGIEREEGQASRS